MKSRSLLIVSLALLSSANAYTGKRFRIGYFGNNVQVECIGYNRWNSPSNPKELFVQRARLVTQLFTFDSTAVAGSAGGSINELLDRFLLAAREQDADAVCPVTDGDGWNVSIDGSAVMNVFRTVTGQALALSGEPAVAEAGPRLTIQNGPVPSRDGQSCAAQLDNGGARGEDLAFRASANSPIFTMQVGPAGGALQAMRVTSTADGRIICENAYLAEMRVGTRYCLATAAAAARQQPPRVIPGRNPTAYCGSLDGMFSDEPVAQGVHDLRCEDVETLVTAAAAAGSSGVALPTSGFAPDHARVVQTHLAARQAECAQRAPSSVNSKMSKSKKQKHH